MMISDNDGTSVGIDTDTGPPDDLELMSGVSAEDQPQVTNSVPLPSAGNGAGMAVGKATKHKPKGSLLPPDAISKAAYEIENLSASAAIKRAHELVEASEWDTFQLGGVLSVINSKHYYANLNVADFQTLVENEFGIKYRTAMYLSQIYEQVLELGIDYGQVKHLGWTKLKHLLNPKLNLITPANLDEWVQKADGMTVLQLEHAVKETKPSSTGYATEQDANPTTSITFKAHADQKETIRQALEKAKELSGTKSDTVALELLSTEFLGKPPPVLHLSANVSAPDGMSDTVVWASKFQELGVEAVLKAFELAFPSVELEVNMPEEMLAQLNQG